MRLVSDALPVTDDVVAKLISTYLPDVAAGRSEEMEVVLVIDVNRQYVKSRTMRSVTVPENAVVAAPGALGAIQITPSVSPDVAGGGMRMMQVGAAPGGTAGAGSGVFGMDIPLSAVSAINSKKFAAGTVATTAVRVIVVSMK